jgi:hypothetical protein
LILPPFTRQWDDRQKMRALQISIVNEINGATSETLMASYYAALSKPARAPLTPARIAAQRPFLERWDVARFGIEEELLTYFPSSSPASGWHEFSSLIHNFQLLPSDLPTPRRAAILHQLIKVYSDLNLGPLPTSRALRRLTQPPSQRRATLNSDYLAATHIILLELERFNNQVLHTPAGYSTTTHDLLRDLIP